MPDVTLTLSPSTSACWAANCRRSLLQPWAFLALGTFAEVMCPDGEARLVVTIRSLSASPSLTPVQDLIDQLLRLDPNLVVVNKQTAQAVLF